MSNLASGMNIDENYSRSMDFDNEEPSLDINEEQDREDKKEGLEQINVQELTGQVLKVCNILREKNHQAKMLFKKTGVVCGARYGANAVN